MIEGLHISPNGPASLLGSQESKLFTREEHRLMNLRRSSLREPRRAQSTHDYHYPSPTEASIVIFQQGALPSSGLGAQSSPTDGSPSEASQQPPLAATPVAQSPTPEPVAAPRRPPLNPPRRSYSVMDYEPIPPTQKPSPNLTLMQLPAEIHMSLFDILDPIDSACLGLTNKHFYDIHRRLHREGPVPLSARRSGPNDLERVWYMAGRIVQENTSAGLATTNTLGPHDLTTMRVRGQALCRKCGIQRCELHKHLQEWMPEGYEYCSIREKFGPSAPAGAKEDCYRSNPHNPGQCGRHRVRKTKTGTQ